MYKSCPSCSDGSIAVTAVMFSDVECTSCGSRIGIHWAAAAFFSTIIFVITVLSTFVMYLQFDLFAAIVWFSFPIGALGYVKARFSPLQIKDPDGY
jgi:uncharacterized protein (DUF983 family)